MGIAAPLRPICVFPAIFAHRLWKPSWCSVQLAAPFPPDIRSKVVKQSFSGSFQKHPETTLSICMKPSIRRPFSFWLWCALRKVLLGALVNFGHPFSNKLLQGAKPTRGRNDWNVVNETLPSYWNWFIYYISSMIYCTAIRCNAPTKWEPLWHVLKLFFGVLFLFHLTIILNPIFSQKAFDRAMILCKSIPAMGHALLQQHQDTLQTWRLL